MDYRKLNKKLFDFFYIFTNQSIKYQAINGKLKA